MPMRERRLSLSGVIAGAWQVSGQDMRIQECLVKAAECDRRAAMAHNPMAQQISLRPRTLGEVAIAFADRARALTSSTRSGTVKGGGLSAPASLFSIMCARVTFAAHRRAARRIGTRALRLGWELTTAYESFDGGTGSRLR
jgi:hypothetical protein